MSVPEIPSNISSSEDTFQDSLRRLCILIDNFRSDLTKWFHQNLTKSQERLQTMPNSMVNQNQIFYIQLQPQVVPGSDLSISKVAPHVTLINRFFNKP